MSDTDLEAARDNAVRLITGAYVRDLITLDQLETRLASATVAAGRSELSVLVADLPGTPTLETPLRDPDFPEPLQQLRGSMQSTRRLGFWLRSRRVTVECSWSSVHLDMAQIEGHPGEPFVLDVSVKGSSVRILVPPGTRVEDDVENNAGSVRIRRKVLRAQAADGPRLVLRGRSWASSIVIGPARSRRPGR